MSICNTKKREFLSLDLTRFVIASDLQKVQKSQNVKRTAFTKIKGEEEKTCEIKFLSLHLTFHPVFRVFQVERFAFRKIYNLFFRIFCKFCAFVPLRKNYLALTPFPRAKSPPSISGSGD